MTQVAHIAGYALPGSGESLPGARAECRFPDADFEVNGAANVEVRLDEDGSLAGYTITGNSGSWTIATTFFDIGASFSA